MTRAALPWIGLLLTLACGPEAPEAQRAASGSFSEPEAVAAEEQLAAVSAASEIEIDPESERGPAPSLVPSPSRLEAPRPDPAAPAAKPGPAAAVPRADPGPLQLAPASGPPGSLFRVPESPEARGSRLAAPATPIPLAPDAPAAWKERVRLQRHSEKIGPSGPRQGSWSETDAAVRMPVSERVQIEGGVRVGERAEPGREDEKDRQSTSRVGVEVRF